MKIKFIFSFIIFFSIVACVNQAVTNDIPYQPAQKKAISIKHEIKDCTLNARVSGPFNPISCMPKEPDGVTFLYSFIVEVDGSVSHPKIICATPVDLDLSHVLEVVSTWEFPVDKKDEKRRRGTQCLQMSKQEFSKFISKDKDDE